MLILRALTILLLAASTAFPCSVPVFRYALDRWAPDPFRLEVPATAPSPQRLMDSLGAASAPNLEVRRDPSGTGTTDSRLFLPRETATPVWSGSIDEQTLAGLVGSPARKEIATRITNGDAAVWVVLSNDGDAELVANLDKRLRYLENAISLPKIDPNDPTSKLGPGPALSVKFSTLVIRRDDPLEATFLPLLLGKKRAQLPGDEAILVPVFGRGRALGAWPASQMNEAQITEAMQFLCGACSCEVKALNPGWDLLMDANWDALLARYGERDPAVRLQPSEPKEPAIVPIPPAPTTETPATQSPAPISTSKIGALAGALALISLLIFRAKRRRD